MKRYLGVECPNCTTLFAVAEFEGAVSLAEPASLVLQKVNCPKCGQHYPQLATEGAEFEAEESPTSSVQ
jgi:endogenous inhibitor of DNA gyrase (YacG/DUF329 family)